MKAIDRLLSSASTTKRLPKAVPYHCREKPRNELACLPALNEIRTTSPIGPYRKM